MPAKGQDTMQTSLFLAKLAGPVLLAGALGLFLNARAFRAMAEEMTQSRALIFLSGLILMTSGVAIVLVHNVWAADWRGAITILGWLMAIGGFVRIAFPQIAEKKGRAMLANPLSLKIGGAIWLVFGAVFTVFGYFR